MKPHKMKPGQVVELLVLAAERDDITRQCQEMGLEVNFLGDTGLIRCAVYCPKEEENQPCDGEKTMGDW